MTLPPFGINQAIFVLLYGICTCIDVLISSMFLKLVNNSSFLYEMNCCNKTFFGNANDSCEMLESVLLQISPILTRNFYI